MLEQTRVYALIKASKAGELTALPYYFDTRIPVNAATLEHVVRLETDRYRHLLRVAQTNNVAQGLDEHLDERVRAQTLRYLGATLLRMETVYVTAETVEAVYRDVEQQSVFVRWATE